jgi:hypothetical protein
LSPIAVILSRFFFLSLRKFVAAAGIGVVRHDDLLEP